MYARVAGESTAPFQLIFEGLLKLPIITTIPSHFAASFESRPITLFSGWEREKHNRGHASCLRTERRLFSLEDNFPIAVIVQILIAVLNYFIYKSICMLLLVFSAFKGLSLYPRIDCNFNVPVQVCVTRAGGEFICQELKEQSLFRLN